MTDLTTGHRTVALDTCVWIYHLKAHPEYVDLTAGLLTSVAAGECRAIGSELTSLELLVRPLQMHREDVADEYEALLTHFPHLALAPVSRDVLLKAAAIRAEYGLRTPDAIIVATGILRGATRLITNDRAWKRVMDIEVVCLTDYLVIYEDSALTVPLEIQFTSMRAEFQAGAIGVVPIPASFYLLASVLAGIGMAMAQREPRPGP